MEKTIIAEGKTTNEAIENGLKQLKVSKDKVEIKVLENEEKRSFFSILAPRVVKVELTLKEDVKGAKIQEKREIKLTKQEQEKAKENNPEDTKYDYLIREEENLFLTMKKQFPNLSLLVIDDAHLLSAKQVDQLLQVAITLHIAVLCYGLRTDFRTSGFEGARRLLELSQVLLKIPTFCECGREALFSVRKENGKTTFQGSQIMDSDMVTYQALCPNCYYRKLLQFKKLRESGRI